MACVGYICATCRTYHRLTQGIDPCPRQSEAVFINGCKREFFEVEAEHLPGKPRFRTYGERDRYLKRHGYVGLGKSDLADVKRRMEASQGRTQPVHNVKAWWRKTAAAYRGVVNRPAFQER